MILIGLVIGVLLSIGALVQYLQHTKPAPVPAPVPTPAPAPPLHPKFPKHWSGYPTTVTKDYVQFPEPYEEHYGSGTIVSWITSNQQLDQTSPWNHLVGVDAKYAKQVIQTNQPDLRVVLVAQGSLVTQDYKTNRVRIFYNSYGNVVGGNLTPKIG